jgi:fucose 4-O-acetylase-like acetyltransferase
MALLLDRPTTTQQSVPSAHALYLFVYLFHMPAFIFLAGHYSGARELMPQALQSIVTRLLAPYVAFTVLYALARSLATGHHLRVDFVLLLVLAAGGLTLVLGSAPVRRVARPFVEPGLRPLLRRL